MKSCHVPHTYTSLTFFHNKERHMPFDGAPVKNEFVTLLRTARDLITTPARHIRNALFKDRHGRTLDVNELDDVAA
jgi:hypothetical protein